VKTQKVSPTERTVLAGTPGLIMAGDRSLGRCPSTRARADSLTPHGIETYNYFRLPLQPQGVSCELETPCSD